jgi:hypothetical protein
MLRNITKAPRWTKAGTIVLALVLGVLGAVALIPSPNRDEPRPADGWPVQNDPISIDDAKSLLKRIPELKAVIESAEAGDVEALLSLAEGGDYCKRVFDHGFTPDICRTHDTVAGVYVNSLHLQPVLGPIDGPTGESVREMLDSILGSGPVRLHFASRDSRYSKGADGEYHLMFRAARGTNLGDKFLLFDKIGMLVRPGNPQPIKWFERNHTGSNGQQWMKELGDVAIHQILLGSE